MHNLIWDFCPSDQRFARELVCSSHPASFRFHLTMDTLAFGYILPTTGRIRDFNPLETCAARRTLLKKRNCTSSFSIQYFVSTSKLSKRLRPWCSYCSIWTAILYYTMFWGTYWQSTPVIKSHRRRKLKSLKNKNTRPRRNTRGLFWTPGVHLISVTNYTLPS